MKKNKHIIKTVQPGSIAEELEIEPGDELISVNDQEIEDVFDYHYLVNDDYLTVLIRKTNGEEWELDIENDYRTMRAELQSNIRNPLSCIKTSCFLIQFTYRKGKYPI